eukprot:2922613-Pyramimonas_sp.AAC.2
MIRLPSCFNARSSTTRGANIARKTTHTLSFVEWSPYVRTISDDSTYENNQWVLGWMKYGHGRH